MVRALRRRGGLLGCETHFYSKNPQCHLSNHTVGLRSGLFKLHIVLHLFSNMLRDLFTTIAFRSPLGRCCLSRYTPPRNLTLQKLQQKLFPLVSSCVSYFLAGSKDLEETEPEILPIWSSIKNQNQHEDARLELENSLQLSPKNKTKQNNYT